MSVICGKGASTRFLIFWTLFKSDNWHVEFPDLKMNPFHIFIAFFFSHRGVQEQWPLAMSRISQTGKHITAPQIPQNLHTVTAENWVQHMLPSYEAHTEADWAGFPTVPSPSPPQLWFTRWYVNIPSNVPGKAFCDASRSSELRTPLNPEQRSGGWMHRWRNLQLVPRRKRWKCQWEKEGGPSHRPLLGSPSLTQT